MKRAYLLLALVALTGPVTPVQADPRSHVLEKGGGKGEKKSDLPKWQKNLIESNKKKKEIPPPPRPDLESPLAIAQKKSGKRAQRGKKLAHQLLSLAEEPDETTDVTEKAAQESGSQQQQQQTPEESTPKAHLDRPQSVQRLNAIMKERLEQGREEEARRQYREQHSGVKGLFTRLFKPAEEQRLEGDHLIRPSTLLRAAGETGRFKKESLFPGRHSFKRHYTPDQKTLIKLTDEAIEIMQHIWEALPDMTAEDANVATDEALGKIDTILRQLGQLKLIVPAADRLQVAGRLLSLISGLFISLQRVPGLPNEEDVRENLLEMIARQLQALEDTVLAVEDTAMTEAEWQHEELMRQKQLEQDTARTEETSKSVAPSSMADLVARSLRAINVLSESLPAMQERIPSNRAMTPKQQRGAIDAIKDTRDSLVGLLDIIANLE